MDYLRPLLPHTDTGVKFTPELLGNYAELIGLEHKIHLMPAPEYKGLAIKRILAAVQVDPELQAALYSGKVLIRDINGNDDEQPQIVLYPQLGQENALVVVRKLEELFADCKDIIGSGLTPRGNSEVDGKLIYYGQGSWDIKAAYMRQVNELRMNGSNATVPQFDKDLVGLIDDHKKPAVLELYKNGGTPPKLKQEVQIILEHLNTAQGEKRSTAEVSAALKELSVPFSRLWETRNDRSQEPIQISEVALAGNPIYGIIQEVNNLYVIGLIKDTQEPIGTIILGKGNKGANLMTYAANSISFGEVTNPILQDMMYQSYYDSFSIYNAYPSDESQPYDEEEINKTLGICLIDLAILTAQQINTPLLELRMMMTEQTQWILESGHTIIEKTPYESGWTNLTLVVNRE